MIEQGLGQLLITSSSFHFFNKTDLEQHLFDFERYFFFKLKKEMHRKFYSQMEFYLCYYLLLLQLNSTK